MKPSESYAAAMAALLVRRGALPDLAPILADRILERLDMDATGRPVVVTPQSHAALDYAGVPVPVADLVAELCSAHSAFFGAKPDVQAIPAPETLTARVRREAEERRRAQAAAETEANPWAGGSVNLTMQVSIEARDPARAARLKAAAGR